MEEHQKVCLKINGKQCVKLRSGSIRFKNYFKQLAVPFKIYVDFESILKRIKSNNRKNNTLYTEKYQYHIPCSFAYKVVCIGDKFSKPLVLYRGKNTINKFIKAILKEYDYCKRIIKKHFNKNRAMSEIYEKRFQSSNKCWICNKLFVVKDSKVRDHDHVIGKYRGSTHWNCNINLKFTKKVLIILHDLKSYDRLLIMPKK